MVFKCQHSFGRSQRLVFRKDRVGSRHGDYSLPKLEYLTKEGENEFGAFNAARWEPCGPEADLSIESAGQQCFPAIHAIMVVIIRLGPQVSTSGK